MRSKKELDTTEREHKIIFKKLKYSTFTILLVLGIWQSDSIIHIYIFQVLFRGFPGGSVGKASACSARDLGSISGSGRLPGEGNGNLLQHSCLENSTGGGDW